MALLSSFSCHGDEHALHNDECAPSGERGCDSLQERESVKALLAATATSKPKVALRAARTSKAAPVQKAQLKQAQKLKAQVVKELYGCRNIGQLREAVSKRQQLPAQRLMGLLLLQQCETGLRAEEAQDHSRSHNPTTAGVSGQHPGSRRGGRWWIQVQFTRLALACHWQCLCRLFG